MKRLTPQGQLLFIYENRIGSGKGLRRTPFVPFTPDLPSGDKWSKTTRETSAPAPAGGPRTSTFCNPLRHNTMQNNLVRGPLKKVGTTNNRFS